MDKLFVGILICMALGIGNFAYQWIFKTSPDLAAGADRTFFQCIAVAITLMWR